MRKQPLWKLSILTQPEADDAVAELLQASTGEPASSYTDVETGGTTVTSYLSRKPAWPGLRVRLAAGLERLGDCGLKTGPGRIACKPIRREDWAESWKRHFKALEIGAALLIKPSWIRRPAREGQAVVVLDPGLSFGTGQHPTTSFCLRQLAQHRPGLRGPGSSPPRRAAASSPAILPGPKPSFLDIGTGSGILAIAAAKLGYEPVEAFDFDPEAVRVARENAETNGVGDRIRLARADLTRLPRRGAKRFDVICANLISTLLVAERQRILARLKPGGVLIVAGILDREFHEVQGAYEAAGMRRVASRVEKEWRSGTFVHV